MIMYLPFKKALICLSMGFLLFLSSCVDEKDLYDPDYKLPNPIEDITVPGNFDWKTMNFIDMEVIVSDKFNGEYSYLIEVFDVNPVSNNTLNPITLGYAKKNSSLKTTITVPKSTEYVYIQQTTPDGLTSVRSAKTDGTKIVCDFSKSTPASGTRSAMTRANDWNLAPPDVDLNDTNLFPTSLPAGAVLHTGSSWVANGTADNWRILEINKQTTKINAGQFCKFYVTEDFTLDEMTKFANRHIYILPGVKLTINKQLESIANWQITIGQGAELIVKNVFKAANDLKIYNAGTITANSIHTIGTSMLYNAGTIKTTTSGDSFHTDTHSQFYNLGVLDVSGNWKATASQSDELILILYNNNEIKIAGTISLNTNTIRYLNDIDGKITSTGYTSTGSSSTLNYGEINVQGLSHIDSKDKWTNKGRWITETMSTKSYDAEFLNACYLEVKEKLSFFQGRFVNAKGSYILTKDLHIENTRIEMYDESFINATGITFAKGSRHTAENPENEGVYGMGSAERSLLRMYKLTTDTDGQQHLYLSGNLQVACDDYPEQYTSIKPWAMGEGAEWAEYNTNTVSIPESECNAGWNPSPKPPVDPEIKDVVDPLTYSYLFEDMWPLYGDYDMNDVVLRIKDITYHSVTEDNKVSKFSFEASLRASGAEKRMAGALMLNDIQASEVKSVSYSLSAPTTFNISGSGIEQNQTNAVVPLFDDIHKFMGKQNAWFINTNPDSPKDNVANPPVMTVTVEFNNLVDIANLNVKNLNFFIITDIDQPNKSVKNNPRREIHLVDYIPTAMGETSIFGNHNDDSSISEGRYYRSEENLPWGIVIPEEFKWPVEYMKILNAYKEFEGWVTSGGTENTEWYKNPTSGAVYTMD